ncbi:MAG: quinolinate synthase NadA [Candidatus Palauibacterales bacterium]|nr:quinolinate synthase NadA [Candidatus Palauibacterales bacterium]MDP2584558.1 quinolinate synthase NadA [Candidatus Palauibacterales bacterium]
MPGTLAYTPQVAEATEHIWPKVEGSIPRFEWEMKAPLIAEINRLKRERNAVILGHNYQVPEIFHGVADFKGDSLGLARAARDTDADVIVFCGVHFMAETAKILNPGRTVLIPDPDAGCSLSESITVEDVRLLKQRHPGVPVVTYVNTPASIKAESDICCTSANAVRVVEAAAADAGSDRVIFLPDEYLARNVAAETDVRVIAWHGRCVVHEQFTVDQIRAYREQYPGIEVIAHPECSPEVCEEADFVGSTTGMIGYLDDARSNRVIMVTECSMSDNVQEAHPDLEFVKPCTLCPHMKKITLENTLASLQHLRYEIEIPENVRARALAAVERMLEVGRDD